MFLGLDALSVDAAVAKACGTLCLSVQFLRRYQTPFDNSHCAASARSESVRRLQARLSNAVCDRDNFANAQVQNHDQRDEPIRQSRCILSAGFAARRLCLRECFL